MTNHVPDHDAIYAEFDASIRQLQVILDSMLLDKNISRETVVAAKHISIALRSMIIASLKYKRKHGLRLVQS